MMLSGAVQLPAELPPHPRLLFTAKDLPAIQERIAAQPWAKARFASLKAKADGWRKREVTLPDRGGQWYHYYSCPKHGARLRTESPTRHVCPVDGEVFTGYPYDDVVISVQHDRLSEAIRVLGIVYQLTHDARYAAKGREILLAYAAQYQSYPLHNTKGEAKTGGGKVGPQTLDESTWLIDVVEGADCFWDTLSAAEQQQVKEGLLYPATDVIRRHKLGIHNIQCWKNSAVGLTGLLIGDMKLVDEALNGPSGYLNQMAKGITPDGAWYEGAWGYHFYTVSAVTHLTEGAFHCGINLYGPEFKGMFDAPLAMAMPDLELPAFNDSHEVSLTRSAGLYETAYARYHDERYRLVLDRGSRQTDAALLHGVPIQGPAPSFVPFSRNFPASGYAILAAGDGKQATWFCLDYGPHGGGHGHPDKLGFVLYGRGQILAPDPGTANYGVPIQRGWYRTTIAHNTLTMDESSQKAAAGKCEAFLAADGFSAVMADAGKIYPGVRFTRTVALINDKLLVFLDQITADKEHTFDLAYHNLGKLAQSPEGAQAFELPKKPGYSYLRDVKSLGTERGLQLVFGNRDGPSVRWAMASGQPTTFLIGTGVGHHTEDRVPLVIARRKTNETTYLWNVSLASPDEPLGLTAEPVELPNTSSGKQIGVAAVRIKTAHGEQILVANPAGMKTMVAGVAVDAKISHLVRRDSGQFQIRHEVR